MTQRVLLGDIGGTHARFAVLSGGALGPVARMAVADHAHFTDALAVFLADQSDRAGLDTAVFGVAGVVENGRCALTNSPWIVDAAELDAHFGISDVRMVNDFEALAWSLPQLTRKDVRQIGGGRPNPHAPMLVLGPGTGLGVAAYVPHGPFVLHSEGGHTTLPAASPREDAVIAALRTQWGRVSAERVLSGPGLENLYRAIAALDAVPAPPRSAAEIAEAALADSCAVSSAALDMFCALLGEVAGNFALAFCAQGGVFIGGGMAAHFGAYLARSRFRARFEAKGRMSAYVEPIPAYLILHDEAAFVGLQALAAQRQA